MASLSSRESAPFEGTPFKSSDSSISYVSSFKQPTVDVIEEVLKHELNGHCYTGLDQNDFFDRLLAGEWNPGNSIKDMSDTVLEVLKKKGLYDAQGERWADIPPEPQSEEALYEPLLKIIEAITDTCYDQAGDTLSKDHPMLKWFTPYQKPVTSERQGVHKPDMISMASRWDWKKRTESEAARQAWWRSAHTPVEVKKVLLKDSGMLQLLRYGRQCLIEQPDRRFLFGFVFAGTHLQVWLMDRTGALSPSQIDIHKKPGLFVQAFVAIALKSPASLGWDTSMKIFQGFDSEGRVKAVYSWQEALPKVKDSKTAEQRATLFRARKWHISAGEHEYVMFDTIALARAEVIRGRATRVWRAWKVAYMRQQSDASQRHIYIVKDCWRDERRQLEGNFYDPLGDVDGVARMEWCGIVELQGPDGKLQKDDTVNLIRQGCAPAPGNQPISLLSVGLSNVFVNRPSDGYVPSSIAPFWEGDRFRFNKHAPPIRNRVHSRLIMRDSGCPIYLFTTISELLRALRDALAGVLEMHKHGVLHRDISINNILINSNPRPKNEGFMIDMDYAALLKNYKPDVEDERSGTPTFMSCEVASMSAVSLVESVEQELNDAPQADFLIPSLGSSLTEPFHHSLSHDLESFFWVLVWLCLYCAGPARLRDFEKGSPDDFPRDTSPLNVADQARIIFEGADWQSLGANKADIFRVKRKWEHVKSFTHDYLAPLMPILDQFRQVVRSMLTPGGRGQAEAAGQKMLTILEQSINDVRYKSWDDNPMQGGQARHSYSREAERERRRLSGWPPQTVQTEYIVTGSEPAVFFKPLKRDLSDDMFASTDEQLTEARKRMRSGSPGKSRVLG